MSAIETHRRGFDDHRHETVFDHAVKERTLLLLPQEGEGDEVQATAARGCEGEEMIHVLDTLALVVGENGAAGHAFYVRKAILCVTWIE